MFFWPIFLKNSTIIFLRFVLSIAVFGYKIWHDCSRQKRGVMHLEHDLMELIRNMGDTGVFIAMFLESSIVPIPSEVILIGAGAVGIPIISIVIFGSLGSTLGGIVGYMIGKHAALPVILKFGRYIFIKPHHIERTEAFAKKYGVHSVLIGRILPVIPFKVFSIAAGITRIPLGAFIAWTFIGVVPRILILSLFGSSLKTYTKPTLLAAGVILLFFVLYKIFEKKYRKEKA